MTVIDGSTLIAILFGDPETRKSASASAYDPKRLTSAFLLSESIDCVRTSESRFRASGKKRDVHAALLSVHNELD